MCNAIIIGVCDGIFSKEIAFGRAFIREFECPHSKPHNEDDCKICKVQEHYNIRPCKKYCEMVEAEVECIEI